MNDDGGVSSFNVDDALRTVSHDVRAHVSVLLSALDELELAQHPARVAELAAMMRRSGKRVENLSDACELARQLRSPPGRASVRLRGLAEEAVRSRLSLDRAPSPSFALGNDVSVLVVSSWWRYAIGEAVAYVSKRAEAIVIEMSKEDGSGDLLVRSDGNSRGTEVGAPFVHALGLAAALVRSDGGELRLPPGDHSQVQFRLPITR